MERLSLLDQLFHKISKSDIPSLNMQGAMVLDPARGINTVSAIALAEHIAARLGDLPILRKKLVQDPLHIGDLRAVEDPHFDIREHITLRTLPSPGDAAALSRAIGEFSAEDLDPDKPLWRFEIIDGLADGKFAIAQKISHATMDGTAAVKVFQCLLDPAPLPLDRRGKSIPQPEPEPSGLQLLGAALRDNVNRLTVQVPRAALQISGTVARSARETLKRNTARGKQAGEVSAKKAPLFKAPRTSLNGGISRDKRNVAYANYDLAELKSLGKSLGCTLNDLCLTLVSESLVTYFNGIGEDIEGDLVIAMPLSTRGAGQREHGNELRVSLISASNTVAPLPARLRAIQAQTGEAKSERAQSTREHPAGGDNPVMQAISPLLLDAGLTLLSLTKLWDRLPPAMNTIMSNVPGPPGSLYFAGMPLECSIPMIPFTHGGALAIGATSTGNIFSFGFHACGERVLHENMHYFIDGLERARGELSAHVAKSGNAKSREAQKAKARGTAAPRRTAGKSKVSPRKKT